jgi:ABC-type amino acid transport substrate-binding protein
MEENKMNNKRILFSLVFTSLLIVGSVPVVTADFTQGNKDFLDALDAALHNIIESGAYDQIYSDWFSGDVVLSDDSTADTATEFPAKTSLTIGGTLDSIISAGKIVFGSDTAYPPFEFMDGDDAVGFDVDMAKAIAEEFSVFYNVTIIAEIKTTDWDPIIPDLQSGSFDAIISAMTKTPERAQQIDFTRAYYTSKQGILASVNSPEIEDVSDLNSDSIKIGVQSGTTSDLYAQENLPDAEVQGFDSFDLAIAALEAGDVHFVLGDLPVLAYYAVENPESGLEVVGNFGDEELFGIGVRKDLDPDTGSTFLPINIFGLFFAFALLAIVYRFRK